MAGFQFAHIETYSRKCRSINGKQGTKDGRKLSKGGRTTRDIFAEAKRETDACHHVAEPCPPVLVFGQSLDVTEQEHDKRVSEAKQVQKNGVSRSIRSTQNTLLTVVLSHPGDVSFNELDEWRKRSIDWLRDRYGDQLKTVIEHTDERHPHLHAYVIPDSLRAYDLHDGRKAKEQAQADGLDNVAQNRAYKDAMRGWQDDYYSKVGQACGLSRVGPKRRRLSRDQWAMEQKQADTIKATVKRADTIERNALAIEAKSVANAEKVDREAKQKADEAERRALDAYEREQKARANLRATRSRLKKARGDLRELVDGGFFSRLVVGVQLWMTGLKAELSKDAERRVAKAQADASVQVTRVKRSAGKKVQKAQQALTEAQQAHAKALASVVALEREKTKAINDLAREKQAHDLTREQREDFRGRWADLDNEMDEIRRKHGGGHDI